MSPMLLLIVELSIYIFYCVFRCLCAEWRLPFSGGYSFREKRTGVFRQLAADHAFDSSALVAGGRCSQKQQTGQRNRLYTIFSHVDFFRHNSSAGNSAESDASGSPFLPIYYGGCADERNIFGDCRRKCRGYSRRDDWSNCVLYGSCRKAFQMGITERIRGR